MQRKAYEGSNGRRQGSFDQGKGFVRILRVIRPCLWHGRNQGGYLCMSTKGQSCRDTQGLTHCRQREAWRATDSSFTGSPDGDKRVNSRGQRAAKRRASAVITIGAEHTPKELDSQLLNSTWATSSETMAAGKHIGK